MIKLLLIVFLSPALVSAKIYFNDGLFPEPATSARALGMGNTYLAKADGTMAVWYNPAGLGTVRYPSFHLNNVHLEGNNGWFDALGKRDGPTKMFKPSHIQKLLKDQRGQLYHTRFHALPNFTGRFFSIGFLYSNQVRGIMAKKEEGSLFELASRNDWGPYTGLAIPFFGGIIKFGASAIWLNREEYYGDSDGEEEFKKIASNNRKGSMVLVTGGFRLTFPWTALPTLALKVNNLTEDEFRFSGENNQPLTIKRTFDGAISITPRLGARTRLHIEVSYRGFNQRIPGRIWPSTGHNQRTATRCWY